MKVDDFSQGLCHEDLDLFLFLLVDSAVVLVHAHWTHSTVYACNVSSGAERNLNKNCAKNRTRSNTVSAVLLPF